MPEPAGGRWVISVLAVAAVSLVLTIALQLQNVRVLVSWHGFLHTAIANRFPGPFQVPENPFFAGERLPYYWLHHDIASIAAQALDIHPLRAFQILTATGLAILWLSAGAIGVRRFGSLRAGLMIGFLVLAGVNPLGPVIAGSRYVLQGRTLFNAPLPPSGLASVFVSDRDSEALMTQPLLPALYVSADWRRGQNVAWYLDNSSRGLAIALIFPLLLGFMGRLSATSLVFVGLMGAAVTAMSPLIGLATVGSMLGGAVAVALVNWFRSVDGVRSPGPTLALATAAAVGAFAVSPTYYHLFLVGGSGMKMFISSESLLRVAALGTNVILLLPMALWGTFRAPDKIRDHCLILCIAAGGLLFVVPFISLTDDTEHNLANTAQCLLVVPAVAFTITRRFGRFTEAGIVALCLPMMCASLASFVGRPSLPVAFERSNMHRPPDDALEQLYQWIRATTSHDAVFIVDPDTPVKMSGNVAELPAFTARTLFTDHESYLTSPHKDFERRRGLSTQMLRGEAISPKDVAYIASLRRPMYLVSYRADQAEEMGRLGHLYGAAVFHDRFVAVFALELLLRGIQDSP